jgi:hypothetical protein
LFNAGRVNLKIWDHPVYEYLLPGRRRGCSPVKALGFAEHLRSYASFFAGEHKPVTTTIPSGEEQPISFETAGEQVLIPRMNQILYH